MPNTMSKPWWAMLPHCLTKSYKKIPTEEETMAIQEATIAIQEASLCIAKAESYLRETKALYEPKLKSYKAEATSVMEEFCEPHIAYQDARQSNISAIISEIQFQIATNIVSEAKGTLAVATAPGGVPADKAKAMAVSARKQAKKAMEKVIVSEKDARFAGYRATLTAAAASRARVGVEKYEGEKGEELTICLEKFERGVIAKKIRCGHVFHYQCLRKWLLTKNNCPLCRRKP